MSHAVNAPAVPDWMAELAERAGEHGAGKEKAEKDARWVGEFSDDLTVAIALREWEKAVNLVEQGQSDECSASFLHLDRIYRQSETVHHPAPCNKAHAADRLPDHCPLVLAFTPNEPEVNCRKFDYSSTAPQCGSCCAKRLSEGTD